MNKKLVMLLLVVLSIIFTFLLSQFGSNPFSLDPVQATYLNLESSELTLVEEDGNEKYYYYLPYLNNNETVSVNLQEFIVLDPNATNGINTLKFSIDYDETEKAAYLDLVTEGIFRGRLTVSGQTSATITISTTDGSSLVKQLFIRPNKASVDEHHGGDIFK